MFFWYYIIIWKWDSSERLGLQQWSGWVQPTIHIFFVIFLVPFGLPSDIHSNPWHFPVLYEYSLILYPNLLPVLQSRAMLSLISIECLAVSYALGWAPPIFVLPKNFHARSQTLFIAFHRFHTLKTMRIFYALCALICGWSYYFWWRSQILWGIWYTNFPVVFLLH